MKNSKALTESALKKCTILANRLSALKETLTENPPLLNQTKLYEENLSNCKDYLESPHHSLAFIGSVGVGKTTAICSLLGLYDPEIGPLLSTSSGRTTLCEVEIIRAAQPKIQIEPLKKSEVEDYLLEFVGMVEMRSGSTSNPEGDQLSLSSEFERCLRNMLGLNVKREKGPDKTVVRRDMAKERLEALGSVEAFLDESLQNLRLAERTMLEFEPKIGQSPTKWLRETFEAINHGRHPDAPMPKRIVIEWPELKVGDDFLNVRVIDTKGLDSNVEREDIDNQLKSPRTICIACSRFNDAPEQSIQSLFSHMREIGLGAQLSLETALLILPRVDEAAKVMAEDGIVADEDEGKIIREEQVEDTLQQKLQVKFDELPKICFFNSGSDSPDEVLQVLETLIENLRQDRINQIEEIEQAVRELEVNREALHAKAAFETVSNAIAAWVSSSRGILADVQQLYKPLVDDIGAKEVYASSIRASVNRRGDWPNFDFHYKLALAARKKVVSSFNYSFAEIRLVLENQERQEVLSPVHPFIREVLRTVTARVERINDRASELARSMFEPPLKGDFGFWQRQQGEWGQGSGYKSRVAAGTENWFRSNNPAPKEMLIQQEVSNAWRSLVEEIEALLDRRS
jgi:hypothetical protein